MIEKIATKKSPLKLIDYAVLIGIDWADKRHAVATLVVGAQ